jgi:peptidoglycan/LPS O-acetylase OafA/YrhL
VGSVLIVYFAISSLLWLYGSLPPRGEVWRGAVFLGRNSLVLYVFSPIFTVLCKRFVPYLQFDHTGLIFLTVSLIVCVAGSLAIAWMMDLTGISRFFFGRKAIRESENGKIRK